jgi:hypothetical protein
MASPNRRRNSATSGKHSNISVHAEWLADADDSGLFAKTSIVGNREAQTPDCGVSLEYLKRLWEYSNVYLEDDVTTAAFVSEAILPLTASGQSRCAQAHATGTPFRD